MINKREPFINFARGFSIITIVLYHFLQQAQIPSIGQKIINLGGAGVHLFIFISGYGLGISKYQGALNFYKRRFLKVLMPYYVVVTFLFASNFFFPIYSDGWKEYLSHIFLYKMFSSHDEVSFGYQLWFISTIIQFYIFFPLILRYFTAISAKKSVVISILISCAYSVTVILLGKTDFRIWNSFFLQFLWEFVFGLIISRLGLLQVILNKSILIFLALGTLSLSIMGLLVLKGGIIGKNMDDYFSFIGYTCYCVVVFKLGVKFINNFIFWVEPFSYSLYLLHVHLLLCYLRIFHLSFLKWWNLLILLPIAFIGSFFLEKFLKKIQSPVRKNT